MASLARLLSFFCWRALTFSWARLTSNFRPLPMARVFVVGEGSARPRRVPPDPSSQRRPQLLSLPRLAWTSPLQTRRGDFATVEPHFLKRTFALRARALPPPGLLQSNPLRTRFSASTLAMIRSCRAAPDDASFSLLQGSARRSGSLLLSRRAGAV